MTIENVLIILNIFLLESMLSFDNAAVLAVMVKDLPNNQQSKALRYGILGAFVFRGLCLFLASFIIKFEWLKIVGGLYLLYLVYGHCTAAKDTIEEGIDKNKNKVYNRIKKAIGSFWSTVILVEIMDIAFSIDNIFAAVAMTNKIWLIIVGVFLGIISMRFIAYLFTILMKKYPSLEESAFIVIALLGIKLIFIGVFNSLSEYKELSEDMTGKVPDLIFSLIMVLTFLTPLAFTQKCHQPAAL